MKFAWPVGEGVSLAVLLPEDLDELWSLIERNRAALTYWFPAKPQWASRAALGEEYVLWYSRLASEPGYTLAIRGPEGMAGLIWHSRVNERHGWCELGYWLDGEAQGQGLVTQAVRAMTEFSMRELGMHRVEVCASPMNVRSCAVPERLGFTREAVLKSRWDMADGRHDQVMYALLREQFDAEWQAGAGRVSAAFTHELGGGLALQWTEPRHAQAVFAAVDAEREQLGQWLSWVADTRSVDDTRLVREETVRDFARGGSVGCSVVEHGRIIGSISLRHVNHGCGNIGFWLAAHAQGRGVMHRCLTAMLDHAFAVCGCRRVSVQIDMDNERSCRVAERAGMVREGVLRELVRDEDKVRDMAVYAMLRDAWEASDDA